MGLFSKKKDNEQSLDEDISLPDLPETEEDSNFASLNNFGDSQKFPNIEISDLPELPNQRRTLDHSIIKSAINEPPPIKKPFENHPSTSIARNQKSKFHVVEAPDLEMPIKIDHNKIGRRVYEAKNDFIKSSTKEIEPVYIRLDKFKTTLEAFEEIKEKVLDIEKLLEKIKDIREKENIELEGWENEIQVIKARIESVDRNVFDKLD